MKAILYILFFLAAGISSAHAHEPSPKKQGNNTIRIQLRMKPQELKDSAKIWFQFNEFQTKFLNQIKKPVNGHVTISTESNVRGLLNFGLLFREKRNALFIVEPGDDVTVTSNGPRFIFTGKGAEKYRMQLELDSVRKSIARPIDRTGTASMYLLNLGEYFGWHQYHHDQMFKALAVLEKYKTQLPAETYEWHHDTYVWNAASAVASHFHTLALDGFHGRKIQADTLNAIYDTNLVKTVNEWMKLSIGKQALAVDLRQLQISRAFDFDSKRLPDEAEWSMLLLEDVFKTKKGVDRERSMIYGLPKVMTKTAFSARFEKLLQAYYADSTFPEWKQWMKAEEAKRRGYRLASTTPDFTVLDSKGNLFSKQQLNGKIAVLYFPGNDASKGKAMRDNMTSAIAAYKNRGDVVFVTVHHQKRSPGTTGAQTAFNVFDIYTGGKESDPGNAFLKAYQVGNDPLIWVLDTNGAVINMANAIDFAEADGVHLAPFIEDRLSRPVLARQQEKDGPYLFDNGAQLDAYTIDEDKVAKTVIEKNGATMLEVQTDKAQTFRFPLQSSVAVQPSVFAAADKMLVLSDIEGNFKAFRKLLQQSKVIDDNFQWTFGKGHLVFAGDMFDRGTQVTECLWLMYALEEKAKAAGGYVHFVLGNHEIMNMQHNNSYAKPKYAKNAELMGKTLGELYEENTVLGRWLRTKNIMEKIGDLLFVHGGISPEMNRVPLNIQDINQLARSAYGQRAIDSSNSNLLTIYSSNYGEKYRISPFWSRGYYKDDRFGNGKITQAQLDSTMAKFSVRRIITGHSIVDDTISVHYGGKVINTDTHHAGGHSEALFIEGDRYMRISGWGQRHLLFIDNRKRGF